MVEKTIKRRHSGLPQLDCVVRVQNIPLVETGIKTAESFYTRVKESNSLFNWYFTTIENVSANALETFMPMVQLAEGPLTRIDQVVCKGLDLVESRVPGVYLPPEMMVWNTKEYMADHFVKPVLRRANSVKKISNAVLLENPVSTFAAEKTDAALSAADAVIDKYLPDGAHDDADGPADNDDTRAVVHAFQHGRRVSKKLKRRLTNRTAKEVAALKEGSKEAVHILVYAAELIITNPKEAVNKAKELWKLLSGPEPENQARPENLEQLIVLITRETARRVVHLINYTGSEVAKIPRNIQQTSHEIYSHFLIASNQLIKAAHLETVRDKTLQQVNGVVTKAYGSYDQVQAYANFVLERLAVFLSGRLEAEKISPNPRRRNVRRRSAPRHATEEARSNGSY